VNTENTLKFKEKKNGSMYNQLNLLSHAFPGELHSSFNMFVTCCDGCPSQAELGKSLKLTSSVYISHHLITDRSIIEGFISLNCVNLTFRCLHLS